MSRLTKGFALALAVGLLTMFGGPASAQEEPAPTSTDPNKVIFTVGSTGDLISANPFKACCLLDYEMLFMNYDMLYNFSRATLEAESALAEFPPSGSEDGKTWTFKIRDDVTWQDGTPLTAEDIAFTFNFINANHLAVFSDDLGKPAKVDPFTAPDPTTFVWKMEEATTSPFTPPWIPIIPKHAWEKYDGESAKTIKEFRNVPAIGSGPFQLVEWQEGRFARFEANHDYWNGDPAIDEVIFRKFGNDKALALALETGEIDFAEALPPELFDRLKTQPGIGTNASNASALTNLAFNFEGTANPAFHDEAVRDAIALAVDRQALVDRVLKGYGQIGNSMVLPTYSKWHWEPTGSEVQPFDPEKAKQILDEGGYTDKDGDGVREGPDGPLTIELLALSDSPSSNPSAKLMDGWLDDVGFDASVKVVSEAKAYDIWADQTFDAYVWGWGGGPDPDFITSIFTTKQCLVWSDGCYKDPEYDKMWEAQHLETDEAKRHDLLVEIQKYLYDKNPELVLFYEQDLQAYRSDRWTGFVTQPEPVGSILFAFGNESYLTLRPVGVAEAQGQDGGGGTGGGGSSPMVWIIIAVVAIIVIVGGVMVARRGKSADDVE